MAAKLEEPQNHRNIVVLGRTCTGKKSLTNQILEKKYFRVDSSMDGVTREASSQKAEKFDPNRKVLYSIKIIDTLGPYSTVIKKKTIFDQIKDYSANKVPEGVNLILFTLRKDVYNTTEETEIIKTMIKDFKDDVREICALVITGCEGLDEHGKESVIEEVKSAQETKGIARFMGKGIHPVGFPSLQNTKPALIEELKQGIEYDAVKLRNLVQEAEKLTIFRPESTGPTTPVSPSNGSYFSGLKKYIF